MRVVPLDRVKVGMITERAVWDTDGKLLLGKGTRIDEGYLKRLKEIGIPALYIFDERIGKVEYEEVLSERTKLETLKVTREVMQNVKLNSGFDSLKVNRVVNDLITEMMRSNDILITLVDMRTANDAGFYHSLNTTVLSVITGMALGYNAKKLEQLACGALFHDVGIVLLPAELINKKTPLTPEENAQVMKHAELGFDILRKKSGVSLLSAHVALQHHEKFDGSGYPRGLAGQEISEFARIVSITAIYDDLVSISTESGLVLPHQAVEYLTSYSGKWFDPNILRVFIKTIALFPVGSTVLLNSGDVGLVTKANKKFPTRPTIRVFKDCQGTELNPPYEIDLAKNHDYFVKDILTYDEA